MALTAGLWVPREIWINKMPPIVNPLKLLAPVHIAASLINNGSEAVSLSAATPCDVTHWALYDPKGMVVQAEEPKNCIQQFVFFELKAGATIRVENTLPVNGAFLHDGERYTVRFKYFGYESSGTFIARVAV
jgi:hypothetical protein